MVGAISTLVPLLRNGTTELMRLNSLFFGPWGVFTPCIYGCIYIRGCFLPVGLRPDRFECVNDLTARVQSAPIARHAGILYRVSKCP